MTNDIFKRITDEAINHRMDEVLIRNEEYMAIQDIISKLTESYIKLNLPQEQKQLIDKLINSYKESNYHYGRLTYQQGFSDCAVLFRDIYI